MRVWRLSLIAVLLIATAACHPKGDKRDAGSPPPAAAASPSTAPPAAAELVSLAWTPANRNQNLQAFDLRATGLDVLAVCHVPAGWTINVTGAGGGETMLTGHATVGAGFLSIDNLSDLAGLFLVRPRPGETIAVTGQLTTGAYGDDEGQGQVPATAALLRRETADRCPPPKG
ncbi:hypothetical protein [uncultured Caulobacter sp.]|uniref:hypothetical protein n=1 Tax=uncultured Caulobacter sp. TaxID=158749 RepID=UPI002614D190|nr:hypothetical protein [uncultured Caulobacter sp.]